MYQLYTLPHIRNIIFSSCRGALLLLCFAAFGNAGLAQGIFSNPITSFSAHNDNPYTQGQVVDPNITVSGIGRGIGITPVGGTNRYNASNWNSPALDLDKYFTFTLVPNSGYRIDFTSFIYTGSASGTGPTQFALRSSLDNFTSNIGVPGSSGSISLTALAYQKVSTPIEFHLYAWGNTNSSGTYSVDDFVFNGTVSLGPALVAGALTAFGNTCINTTSGSNVFTLSGSLLTTAPITVAALAGFTFSTDNATFSNSLSITHPAGAYSSNIYVRFSPVLVQSYAGNIIIGGGGAASIAVPASGNGVNTKPVITSGAVSGITTNSANVSVTITSPGCSAVTTHGVEYSTVPGFANGSGIAIAGSAIVGGNFTVALSGLTPPGQTFYIHTYATNAGGVTYGTESAFTLLNTVPTLSVPASGSSSLSPFGNVCINTALTGSFTLSGSVLNGSNIVIGPLPGFKFATSSAGPFNATVTLVNAGAGYSYASGNLTATIYVQFIPLAVQSYSGNIPISGGGAPSITASVTGAGINDQAVVSSNNAVSITTVGAILSGNIVSPGCGVLFGYGIEYSTVSGFVPGSGTQVAASNLSSGAFSVSLSALTPNTIYYFYAYAITAGGTSYSTPEKSFLTATSPTKLIVTSITPASPTALTPFSITITAVDDLLNNTPTNVTSNTDININQVAGASVLTVPSIPAGTIPAGSNSITITGTFYDVPENGVGLSATAVSGMTILGTSPTFTFNVIAYVGSPNFTWSNNGGSAWLSGASWQGGTSPGSSVTNAINHHSASFTSLAGINTSGSSGLGLNMGSVGSDYAMGAIYFQTSYATNHIGNVVPFGNSSGSVPGVFNMYGASINNVGGIAGNNFSDLFIANYMTGSTTKTFEVRNGIGGSAQNMTLNLAVPGSIVAGAGRTINLNLLVTGTQPLLFSGGGTLVLTPAGAATANTFSGAIRVANGTLIAGNTGAFSATSPNLITLGSAPALTGVLRLNGNSVAIGGLTATGTAGVGNLVDNGSAAATLTINNTTSYIFNGAIKNGTSGTLSLIKNGGGSQTLQGINTFTGPTTINKGTLVLANPGGGTMPAGSIISVNGTGILQVSTDQIIKDLSLATGGTLKVDAGVTLTITGTYNAASCNIINNGTIKLKGNATQFFPGTAASVVTMNNLTVENPFAVSLNNSLNIGGTLTLTSGAFNVGPYTLTLNNPIAGTVANFSANNTSSIIIAGTAANVNIPAVVTQLKSLTVTNAVGSTLQGDLAITTTLFISNGTLSDDTYRLTGAANVTMTAGTLDLQQNTALLPGLTGVYVLSGGTVIFNGVGVGSDAQIVRPVNYYNLSSASTGSRVLSPTGIIGVANVFTPNLTGNTYTVVGSTVDYNKPAAQTVAAFKYYSLTVSGAGLVTKSLGGPIEVQGTLTLAANTRFGLGDFNTTLKSTAANTADVAPISTNNSILYGNGRFIVERYIPTGVAHGKSWQLLAVPVSGPQSVNAAWQEGNSPLNVGTSGLGTTISSEKPGAVARGFDFFTAVGPSLKKYDPVTNKWVGIDDGSSNTSSIILPNKKGYMLLVRGDRSVQTSAAPANVTTLRTTGKLYSPGTDKPLSTNVGAGKFETVGNPYAAAIDFTSVLATSTNIDSKYYVWDPLLPNSNGFGLGGYQVLSSVNLWKPTPGGTINYPSNIPYTKIHSGQAFFVYATNAGTVDFSESNKTTGDNRGYRPADIAHRQFLRGYLQGMTGQATDGNVVAFDPAFNNGFDSDDALKIDNGTESFALRNGSHVLAVQARNLVASSDTLFYEIAHLNQQVYKLRFEPENVDSRLTAFFVDKLLGFKSAPNPHR